MIKCELCGRYNNKAELTAGRHAICDDCADALMKATARIRQVVEASTVDDEREGMTFLNVKEALADVPESKPIEGESDHG